ncbi:hypothetical protein [Arthrobacter globiformis]|uniref:hypothetical protein n=1 Tax=Arthrobacter globiformis TaxID=1665 RepID=UPI003978105E
MTCATPGGFYAFITAGLGRKVGLSAGFGAIVTYFAALLSVYALSGIALNDIVSRLFGGPELAWPIEALVVLVAVTALGHLNIDFSAKALVVFLGLEMLLVAVYVIAVFANGGRTASASNRSSPPTCSPDHLQSQACSPSVSSAASRQPSSSAKKS